MASQIVPLRRRAMPRTLVRLVAVVGLVMGLLVVSPNAAVAAAPGDTHFRSMEPAGGQTIYMCRDWTTAYGDGVAEAGTCKNISDGGAKRDLYPGQTTNGTFGWSDTDGFYVPYGWVVAVRASAGSDWQEFVTPGWRKYPGSFGSTRLIVKYPA